MNTYRQYDPINSELILIIECYCPKCKLWFKIEDCIINQFK